MKKMTKKTLNVNAETIRVLRLTAGDVVGGGINTWTWPETEPPIIRE